eukprot:COSAG01_NODE_28160_length_667_cov_3.040493_1_plen_47_part_00
MAVEENVEAALYVSNVPRALAGSCWLRRSGRPRPLVAAPLPLPPRC